MTTRKEMETLADTISGTPDELAENPLVQEAIKNKREREFIQERNEHLEKIASERQNEKLEVMGVDVKKLTHQALIGALWQMQAQMQHFGIN